MKPTGAKVDQSGAESDPTARPIQGEGGEGWQPTTLAAMLSLTEADMRVIELRLGLISAVRHLREVGGWSRAEAAGRLEVSPARYAEIESSGHQPTLDQLIPAFFGLGGTVEALCQLVRATDGAANR